MIFEYEIHFCNLRKNGGCIIEDAIKENKVEIPGGIFNPKKKIEEYVSSETNGFNLEEVLNPGELDLGDLCKELGLTEE